MRPQPFRRSLAVCCRKSLHPKPLTQGSYIRFITSTPSVHAQRKTISTPRRAPSYQKGFDVWGEIPPPNLTREDFVKEAKQNPNEFRYSPDEYMAIIKGFLSGSARMGADWPFYVKDEHRPSKEILNDLGYFMTKMRAVKSLPQPLYMAMLSGASSLGCEASCISAARTLFNSDSRHLSFPLYKPIKTRFDQILRNSKNPYAIALEGFRMMKGGKHAASIRVVQRALDMADENFAWRPFSLSILGHAYEEIGEHDKALESLRAAANGGEVAPWDAIARLTPSPEEQREAWFKTAQLGSQNAIDSLRNFYQDVANQAPADSSEQKQMYLLSAEFERIKDPEAQF